MDASALLSQVEQLSQQVSGLRKALDTQADVSENLGAIVTAVDRRVAAVETHRTSDYDPGTAGTVRPEEQTTSPAVKSRLLGLNRPTGEIASTSRVDWKGLVGSTQVHSRSYWMWKSHHHDHNHSPHCGALLFSPTLDADTLRDYLTEKLEAKTVTCRKIESARSRYQEMPYGVGI
ncbi:unnamed protein product [Gadus morhua 'NCC']